MEKWKETNGRNAVKQLFHGNFLNGKDTHRTNQCDSAFVEFPFKLTNCKLTSFTNKKNVIRMAVRIIVLVTYFQYNYCKLDFSLYIMN